MTLSRFVGTIEQVPPMHSALKHDGQPLYKLARAGSEVERAPRQISVHRLALIERREGEIVVDVECSKGTYVRVLAEDIGRALGCGAHLSALRRTRAGRLSVDDAVTLADARGDGAGIAARQAAAGGRAAGVAGDRTARRRSRRAISARAASGARGRAARAAGCACMAARNELLGTATISEWGVVEPERLVTNN